jgi:hypothetical protein
MKLVKNIVLTILFLLFIGYVFSCFFVFFILFQTIQIHGGVYLYEESLFILSFEMILLVINLPISIFWFFFIGKKLEIYQKYKIEKYTSYTERCVKK